MTLFHEAVKDRVYLSRKLEGREVNVETENIEFHYLEPSFKYQPYCDDFGPLNMASTIHFIRQLDTELSSSEDCKVLVYAEEGKRALTNAIYLIGSYMIIRLRMKPDAVAAAFANIDPDAIESYRDATYAQPDFRLHLIDCWRGLARGRAYGWVRDGGSGHMWGAIDVDEYEHYGNPCNGNLHEVVPGKLIAFQSPADLGGAEYRDHADGARSFSPGFYATVLRDMGAEAVVRLSEPCYDARELASRGLAVHDLPFSSSSGPPAAVVDAFLRLVDDSEAAGPVAVHCQAGLGRTGTLIGVWLMRSRGFTAREAMGWLRIMRPGSVIGAQQRFLCAAEDELVLARLSRRSSCGRRGQRAKEEEEGGETGP